MVVGGTVAWVLPLGFQFHVDAVVLAGTAHRTDCPRIPPELPPEAVLVPTNGIYWAACCPSECADCIPPFETLLSYQLDAAPRCPEDVESAPPR
jgi:hypothetical protein